MTATISHQRIRVAIIGLSASAVANWAADAHLPALLSDRGRNYFDIVALCNSSVSAAQAAIKHYALSVATKAYGSPQDLAHDPDIDLVICNTRVDKHKETILPSINAGKDVYVEWPVASNSKDVKEIAEAAEKSGVRIVVGLQGKWAPPVLRIKQILEREGLGKVLSSEMKISGGPAEGNDDLGPGWEYFAQRAVGGNSITILAGHAIDQVQSVLGFYVPGTTHAHAQIQHPNIRVVEKGRVEPVNTISTDVPDLLFVHGTLVASNTVTDNASLAISYQRNWPIPGQPTLSWTTSCERGEILMTAYAYPSLQADAYSKPVKIQVLKHGSDSVQNIDWSWTEEQLQLPVRARNTLNCLCAFAEGDEVGLANLASAAVITEQLEAWLSRGVW